MGMKSRLHNTGATWCDIAAMLAVACVAMPFATLPFAYFPYASAPVRVLGELIFFVLGWGIQDLFCRLLRHSREKEGSGYEVKTKYYRIGLALPVWGAAAAVFFVLLELVDQWLYYTAANSTMFFYDPFSAYPATAGGVAAALMLIGGATRLYPYTRVVSMRACMTYIALFLIGFVLGGGAISAISLFVFALCAALLLNQSILEREGNTLSLPDVPQDIRMSGVSSVLWLGMIFLGACAVLIVIAGGGMMVGRVLFFMLLRGMFGGEGGATHQYESTEEVIDTLGRYLVRSNESPLLNYLLMILFVVGLVLAVIWFALRNNENIRRRLRALWDRFAAFLDWLFGASTRIYYRAHSAQEEVSYRDVRKKLAPSAHVGSAKDASRLSWREFRSRLNSYATDEAKLTYAYAVLVAVLRAQPQFPLLRADTPRRIEQKVRARDRHHELHEITAVYEIINYAQRSPDPLALDRALTLTCNILREYFS